MSWPSTTHVKTAPGLAEVWERYAGDVESSTTDMLFLAEAMAFRAAAQQLRALVAEQPPGGQRTTAPAEPALIATLRRIGDLLGLLPGADLAIDVERAVRGGLASARLRAAPVLWQYRLRERPGAAWGPWLPVPANEVEEWQEQIAEMPGAAEMRPLVVSAWPAIEKARAAREARELQP